MKTDRNNTLKNNVPHFKLDSYGAIKENILEVFKYENEGKDITVKIFTEEFSAVCPFSGLPDYGRITVEYIPKKVILELRSFKYYLYTFRNVGIYQEHAINKVFEALEKKVKPKQLKITLEYNTRGGIVTTVTRESKFH